MKTILSETDYKHVPAEQQERLHAFRTTHPRQQINLSGAVWSYLLGGQGPETFLILPGGERIGDVAFPLMQQFEQEYRCLYPSFPPFSTMAALVDGLAALLDRLSVGQVILFVASFGGDVGQCFVRTYPERVSWLNYHFSPADLATWPGKVLILQSDDDPATTPAMRLALRTLYPQAQVHTFHQAGHTAFLSQPDEFYPRVRAFLRQP